jgi:preprotein translocase subunit SecA
MTGTAETEAAEFANTYNVPVVPIPTNKPMIREDQPGPHLQDRGRQVRRRGGGHRRAQYAAGQPVLVGTASVAKSEHLSRLLEKPGDPPRGPERQAALPGGGDRRPGRPLHG